MLAKKGKKPQLSGVLRVSFATAKGETLSGSEIINAKFRYFLTLWWTSPSFAAEELRRTSLTAALAKKVPRVRTLAGPETLALGNLDL